MECPKCGINLLPMLVHRDDVCEKQQRTNRRNLSGGDQPCPWCGSTPSAVNPSPEFDHKEGCPRRGR